MALTADQIAQHPALNACIRRQSQALLMTYEQNPRVASVFASQQRWLFGHVALQLHFRRDPADDRSGLNAARFFDLVARHEISGRNTADAFIKEMLKYGIARYVPGVRDRRVRAVEPTETTLAALAIWMTAHLGTLDRLDGADRLERYRADPHALARLQPLIADSLLVSYAIRHPETTFSLFVWVNNGGIVMDWLIAGIEETADRQAERIPTGPQSVGEMAAWLRLSRTHLSRKLREAEDMGSIGWQGKRGNSVMWMSREFHREYVAFQAAKLAIVDAACDACFAMGSRESRDSGKPADGQDLRAI